MAMQRGKRRYGSWLFLGGMLLVYAVFGILEPDGTRRALAFFVRMLPQVLPVLALVFVLIFVFNLFVSTRGIKRYLGAQSGLKGWLTAMLAGIVSMGPLYAWLTMLHELRQKGTRLALITAFLYCRAIRLPHYFGLAYTAVVCAYIAVFSVLNGLVIEKLVSPDETASTVADNGR